MPKGRASWETEETTPRRSGSPPAITGSNIFFPEFHNFVTLLTGVL
jgi:hypothetical protein